MKLLYLKIIIITILILSFFQMPYGYYQFLRIALCVVSMIIFYDYHKRKKNIWLIPLGVLIILFNPLFTIHFKKDIWQIIDGVAVIIYIVSVIYEVFFDRKVD